MRNLHVTSIRVVSFGMPMIESLKADIVTFEFCFPAAWPDVTSPSLKADTIFHYQGTPARGVCPLILMWRL